MTEGKKKAKEEVYDADSIRELGNREAVRLRPGMYVGDNNENGLHQLVYEIVDNSVDEALAGYCDLINVTIQPGLGGTWSAKAKLFCHHRGPIFYAGAIDRKLTSTQGCNCAYGIRANITQAIAKCDLRFKLDSLRFLVFLIIRTCSGCN